MIRSRVARAFTLVEVLIATFIIALGVLGLLALFAGAARQQQTATQVTLAATAARNAEAIIGNNFGKLQNASFAAGEWRVLPIASVQYPYLTVNPNCDPQGPYFLVDSLDPLPHNLYQWTQTVEFESPYPALFEFDNRSNTSPPPRSFARDLRDVGQRRIDPDSVFLQVELVYDPPFGAGVQTREVYNYYRVPDGLYTNSGTGNSLFDFTRDGVESMDQPPGRQNFITLDCQFSCTGTQPARIAAMRIDTNGHDPNLTYIAKIDLVSYKWRNDQLVSLGNRTITRYDPAAPGQSRPDIVYSVLFRRLGTASQMCVFTYQLTPGASSARFVPPETEQILYGPDRYRRPPVRRADVDLHYDKDAKAYYITLRSDPEESLWVMAPGQVLLVAQQLSPVGPGADAPVKIVRRERRITGSSNVEWRGYLSDSPRSRNKSLLTPSQRDSGLGAAMSVFGVNDVVQSLQDNSDWRLKPLEAFVFQVSGS